MLRDAAVLFTVLALTTGCGSTTSPTGPTSLPVTIQHVGGSRRLTDSEGYTYAIWATVVTAAAVTGPGEITVTLSGGAAPAQTYREPRAFSLAPGTWMLNFQIPDQAGVAHTVVQITMALTDAGKHPHGNRVGRGQGLPAPGVGGLSGAHGLVSWRDDDSAVARHSNRQHRRHHQPHHRRDLRPEGSTEITPCPGNTVFDLSTHNISGESHVHVPVTVGPPPRTPWYCGTWSGASTETWTDSAGTPGSWSGGVMLSGFQSGGRVTRSSCGPCS